MVLLFAVLFAPCPISAAPDADAARVNGRSITERDLEAEVGRLIPRMTIHGAIPEERRNEFREKALKNLVDQELQYQDALRMGLKPDKKQIKERLKQVRDKFGSRKEYKKALKQADTTEDELQEKIERESLVQAVKEKAVIVPSRVGEDELKRYYAENRTKFRQPESVRLRLISTKDEKKAKEVLGRVKAGEDFGNLAAQMSEDMYRIKGGDIGYVHRGRVFPEVEEAAFRMKIGETSGLIQAKGTWFVIKVEDRKPEHELTFDDAKEKLKKDLEAKRSAEIMEKWMTGLRVNAKIEILSKEAGDGVKP